MPGIVSDLCHRSRKSEIFAIRERTVTKVAVADVADPLIRDSKEFDMNTTTQTVREIALEQPTSIRVFEQFGIDYCCGGRKPVSEACMAGNLEVDTVIAALEAAAKKPGLTIENWFERSLQSLISHIVATHHAT